ncbi:hypothetical protein AMAG_12930 [Allomyces macrogynus ATCC 38327]|uniref:Tim44-like domain-containing protein n=1 Tax=Allomyces macrogynus (strain ATCC 38327) TaxID=578462 RepID=A0A0L0T0G2_ALLM3|nr:hypothetical protein AMAG_12930 [Allomyces macrogynus ATCC 38327]|eukprot:KNE68256.1 hypothetical protein AMAG_12930 [Allomyces macrogynus ATCC 38327]
MLRRTLQSAASSSAPSTRPPAAAALARRRPSAAAATASAAQRRWNSDNSGGSEQVGPGQAFFRGFVDSVKRQVQENKELKENVKQLSAGASKIAESDSLKKAMEISKESVGVTSEALRKTGEVAKKVGETVKDAVEVVAETPIAKAATTTIKTTANVVGQAASTAVKPITDSEAYKQVTEDLAKAIQDSSSRYGGITSKRYRELLKRQRQLEYELKSKITANEEALGMVMHEGPKWKRSWDKFKETSPVMQNLLSAQKTIAESDNLVVSWGRFFVESFQDRFGGVFEETETAKALTLFKQLDPKFTLDGFLKEAREFILPELLEAWLAGDKDTLSQWCSEGSVKVLTAGHDEIVKQGLVSDSKLIELKGVDVTSAKVLDNNIPVLVLSFHTQEVILYRDRISKEVRLGKPDVILRCTYVLVMTIQEGNTNPVTRGWTVVDQAKHSGGATW